MTDTRIPKVGEVWTHQGSHLMKYSYEALILWSDERSVLIEETQLLHGVCSNQSRRHNVQTPNFSTDWDPPKVKLPEGEVFFNVHSESGSLYNNIGVIRRTLSDAVRAARSDPQQIRLWVDVNGDPHVERA